MAGESFVVLPAEIREGENGLERTAVPRGARVCKGPHEFDATVVNNKVVGYVGKTYNRADHEYPKVLYHPKWNQKPAPEANRFFVGAVTQEQHQNAFAAYEKTLEEWKRTNRIKIVKTEAEEKKLLDKGWLATPPVPKDAKRFDLESDEI